MMLERHDACMLSAGAAYGLSSQLIKAQGSTHHPHQHAWQVELGIGPMGHRAALLDAVAALAQEAEDMGEWSQ
jgi:hypothetical protein